VDGAGDGGAPGVERAGHIDDSSIRWPFQRSQLAPEHPGSHEVLLTPGQPILEDRRICSQQNEPQWLTCDACAQSIPNELRQRRARDDCIALRLTRVDLSYQRLDPRRPVRVGQRGSPSHLLHVALRVKVVGLDEGEGKLLGYPLAEGRLASAGHSHENENCHRKGYN
jgi:hypothetical protein